MAAPSELQVLQIGAGGIGCELLKLLVMSGFSTITVLDLDSIDISNLNRQFLFRRCHVGQSKAKVAAAVVSQYRPGVLITPIQAPVQNFGSEFFKQFQIVFNALDNDEARRHVNRICTYLKLPLVEAGTQGYLGQVNVHFPPRTACFECEPRAAQKTYAVCTIRSTPDKPVHCIVWAKYLYEALFGLKDESNILSEVSLSSAPEMLMQFFTSEISASQANVPKRVLDTEANPEIMEAVQVFSNCVNLCSSRPRTSFDKDDDLSMKFVWSASSLRSFNFFIPLLSLFSSKEIAGNIIPAVASTNGIAAALQVAEGLKLLQKHDLAYRSVWINEFKSGGNRLITAGNMQKPKPGCIVCNGSVMKLELRLDVGQFTLGRLVGRVLKTDLAMHNPSICFGQAILHESGQDLDAEDVQRYETLGKSPLSRLGIDSDSVLICDVIATQDFSQQCKVELWIRPDQHIDEKQVRCTQYPELYILSGSRTVIGSTEGATTLEDQDDSDFEVITPGKRLRTESQEQGEEGRKRAKLRCSPRESDDDVAILEVL